MIEKHVTSSASHDAFIDMKNVTFFRGNRRIHNAINLTIPRHKITGIMGPSGCGKTTLLRLIAAQVVPDAGTIFVNGQCLRGISRGALFALRRTMGMLFQSGALFTDMTVFENVAFPLQVHTNLSKKLIRDVVFMKLEAVGLRGAKALMPSELSGGMARRVALARAIALDPDLIMYDEPFAGQDPISKGVLVKLISDLNKSLNITSVIVSHDIDELMSIADYLCLLVDGNIVAYGTPEAVRQSTNSKVAQFVQGNPDGPIPFHYQAIDYNEELRRGTHDRSFN